MVSWTIIERDGVHRSIDMLGLFFTVHYAM